MASYEEDLFWKTAHGPTLKGKEAVAASNAHDSPEQTGQRLVVLVRAWLTHALEQLPEKLPGQLPEDCRAWFRVNLDRPGFSDPETPHLALGELQYLTKNMPYTVPDGWELDRGQRLAVKMLMSTRDTIHATFGTTIEQASQVVVMLERAMGLGIAAARAHVEPWEPVAKYGLEAKEARRAGPAAKKLLKGAAKEAFRDAWSEWIRAGAPGLKGDFDKMMAERFHISAKVAEKERLGLQQSLSASSEGEIS